MIFPRFLKPAMRPFGGRPYRKARPGNLRLTFPLIIFLALIALKGASQEPAASPDAAVDRTDTLILTQEDVLDLARENNLVLKNAELELEQARAGKRLVVYLEPAEFRYTYGQINTSLDDRFIEIEQNLGSILTHIQRSGYVQQEIRTKQSNLLLTRAELERRVKSLYQYWLYQYSILSLAAKEHEFYLKLSDIAGSRYENGETSLLERSLVETQLAGVKNQLKESERLFYEAGNLLQQVLQVDEVLIPGDTVLRRLPMLVVQDAAQSTLIDQYYDTLYRLEQANVKLEKSRFFPGLSANYFNQTIDQVTGFSGFQVGMSFPLWFLPQGGRIQQAKLQSEIARNEMLVQAQKRDRSVVNLQEKIRSYEDQLAYYEETALKSSTTLIRAATAQLEQQGIEYFEFIGSVTVALDIRREYLRQMIGYNETVIELEFLVK
jgi:cobalt-zinc-cadmium resistance protein CzcA